MADDVLHQGVRSITDLMVKPGLINLDFADVQTVMKSMGRAMMGTGQAEGENRASDAAMAALHAGLADLEQHVDTLIVIPNQNLFKLADSNTTFANAFQMADDVLHQGVRSITDLMVKPGLINLDFADV